jgi:hypothetical protein
MKNILRLLAATGALLVLVNWSLALEFNAEPAPAKKAEQPAKAKVAKPAKPKAEDKKPAPQTQDDVEQAISKDLAVMLADPDGFVRVSSINVLENFHANAVPSLIEMLQNPDDHARELAVLTLRRIGPEAKDAVPALIERLKDKNPNIRFATILALRTIGPEAPHALDAIPVLAIMLADPDGMIRGAASYSLIKMQYDSVPCVVAMLKHPDPIIRRLAVEVLRYIGEEAEESIPDLIARLSDSDANVREAAVFALRYVGEDSDRAVDAIPALAQLLKDRDGMVRRSASYSLIQFKAASVPSVIELTKCPDAVTRELAVKVLRYIGPDASDAVPALVERLRDKEAAVREAAELALRDIVARAALSSL